MVSKSTYLIWLQADHRASDAEQQLTEKLLAMSVFAPLKRYGSVDGDVDFIALLRVDDHRLG
jgi:hypothetical protein